MFDHDELGIDLERAKALPECSACRKKSDGAQTIGGVVLCGTDFDAWSRVNAERSARRWPRVSAEAWAAEQRSGKYRACWEAKVEP